MGYFINFTTVNILIILVEPIRVELNQNISSTKVISFAQNIGGEQGLDLLYWFDGASNPLIMHTTPEPGASGPKLTQPILRGDLHE